MATTEIGTQQDAPFTKSGRRSSVFSALIAALHESRRLEAARIVRSYQHLCEEAGSEISQKTAAPEMGGRVFTSPVNGGFPGWNRLGVKSLITLVLLGFGILHLIGGALLDHARAAHAVQNAAFTAEGD
jgi:UDP-N-acetylmuramyl pentapeptide phosphotransferase/UDP-N-acetylglucosamine-1-phosphate transferase